jgi:hypothetical protein
MTPSNHGINRCRSASARQRPGFAGSFAPRRRAKMSGPIPDFLEPMDEDELVLWEGDR